MPLALPPPHRLARVAALAPFLVLAACPKPDPLDPDSATGTPEASESMGATDPGEGATMSPTTGALPNDTDDKTTTEAVDSTTGDDPSDSSSGSTTIGGDAPDFGHCPYDPPGVEIALSRVQQGIATDLGARPCGTSEELAALAIVAADADHLEATVCSDATCGACDPADTLSLSLAIPESFEGLPPQIEPGDCMQLAASWHKLGGEPDACAISSLALVRQFDGGPEPVPTFLYRYTETLPATDVVGSFTLTTTLAGPAALSCPCQGDCCLEVPGARRLRFVFTLGKAVIEGPPVESGAVVPAFAFGTPEGDELLGSLALVRSYAPSTCATPPRHEWIVRVTPG